MRKLVLQFVTLIVTVVVTLVVPLPLLGQNADSLLQDATSYAALEGVSVDEALRRLRLQQQVGELETALTAEENATFAGLWIQHEPQYRVVARFTDPAAEARLRARLAGGPLADLIETRPARWSLAELEDRRQQVRGHARRGKVAFNSDINVFENRVEIYVLDPHKLTAALAAARAPLPDAVVVQRVTELAVTEALVGGSPIAGCTGGFTVQAPNGELGISTAAHCPDGQSFNGLSLPFRNQRYGGEYDVQWNSACDIVEVTNQFNSGIGLRSCTSTRSRTYQTIGTFLCKFGKTTGRTCGTIDSKTYDPGSNFNDTFIRVDGDRHGVDLSQAGDSGSPWFVEDIAYGIHHGAPSTTSLDSIYMPINYISAIGVSVLTSSPGACNLLPKPSFTWARRLDGVSFDASGSFDPDGAIVRYEWNFDDGTTAVTTSPTILHPYPRETASYYVTLTVVDNEGKRAAVTNEVVLCYPLTDCREF